MKAELQKHLNLPDSDFGYHESDLYVKDSPQVTDYLQKNYQFWCNCKKFKNRIDGKIWIEIPFANSEFWAKKISK